MLTIVLNPGEIAIADLVAHMRNATNHQHGVSSAKMSPRGDVACNRDGILGELAFAKAQNVFPDFAIGPRAGSYDLVVYGIRVDVKATRNPTGDLLARAGKDAYSDVDAYVLAVIEGENVVRLAGWCARSELLHPANKVDLGHGPSYALPQAKLRPFKAINAEAV